MNQPERTQRRGDEEELPLHELLIEKGACWLRSQGASVVITDMAHGFSETPDAIGWRHTSSTLIECKASRADFLADRKKTFRCVPEQGVGEFRYFLVPRGLVKESELPIGWGLLEWTGKRVRRIVKAVRFENYNHRSEMSLVMSALRRIGQSAPDGVSVKCYTYNTKNRATVGVMMI